MSHGGTLFTSKNPFELAFAAPHARFSLGLYRSNRPPTLAPGVSADVPAVNRERFATTSATAFAQTALSPHSSRLKLGFNSGLRKLRSIGPRESRISFNSSIAFCHCFVSVIFRRNQPRFVAKLCQQWRTTRTKQDWKSWICGQRDITKTFLTRAVNKGELEVPTKARK